MWYRAVWHSAGMGYPNRLNTTYHVKGAVLEESAVSMDQLTSMEYHGGPSSMLESLFKIGLLDSSQEPPHHPLPFCLYHHPHQLS